MTLAAAANPASDRFVLYAPTDGVSTHDLSGFAAVDGVTISGIYNSYLKTGSCVINSLEIAKSSSTFTNLSSNLIVSGRVFITNSPTFNASGYDVTCPIFVDSTQSANTANIIFGSGTWTFTGSSGTLITRTYATLNFANTTLKFNDATPASKIVGVVINDATTRIWVAATGTVGLSLQSGSNVFYSFTADAGTVIKMPTFTTCKAGTWRLAGNAASYVTFTSAAATSAANIASDDFTTPFYFDYCVLKDIQLSPNTHTNFIARSCIDNGNNLGFVYYKLNANFASFF
jgi:hypothetical protein